MSSAHAMLREQPNQADFQAWIGDLIGRYHRLSARGAGGVDALRLARLGGKLCELQALVCERTLPEREAGLLPRFACWVAAQLEELEAVPVVQPLTLPIAPAPDPRRAAALAQAILVYGQRFDGPPSAITVRRLDALLATYPLAAVAEALAHCAQRYGEFQWRALEEALVDAASSALAHLS